MDYNPIILYKKWIILCLYILVCAIPHKEKRHQSVKTDAFLMIYLKKIYSKILFHFPIHYYSVWTVSQFPDQMEDMTTYLFHLVEIYLFDGI